jgi:DNA-binding NtrC family response regulator
MQDAVLIIEDNHDFRVCQRQVLEERGLQVYSVTNGKDALNLIQSGFKPIVIILDLVLPFMSGEEFLKVVKGKNLCPESKFMIVSGKMGADEEFNEYSFLSKPVDWQNFLHTTVGLVKAAKMATH